MGRLTKDPELRKTAQDISVVGFSIAVDRNYVKKGEERQTDFFDVVAWRGTADFIAQYFGKGDMIAVDGQLQTRTYEAKDGSTRKVVEINADTASFTGGKKEAATIETPKANTAITLDDDLPFD
jgi:single-strand DNA-binding protein